jgi:hypothetical protein
VVVKKFFSTEVLECRSSDCECPAHQAIAMEGVSTRYVLTIQDAVLNFEINQVNRIGSLNDSVIRSNSVNTFHSESFNFEIHDFMRLNQNTAIDDRSSLSGS